MKPVVVVSMALMVVGLAALAWLAKPSDPGLRPAQWPSFGGAVERAAQAAQGRRLIVAVNIPGQAATAVVLQSARGPTGWGAYAPTPDPADPLCAALARLGDAVAVDLARSGKLESPTLRALTVFDVAVVVVGDGTNVARPVVEDRDAALGVAGEVPALRVRKAEPAYLFLADEPAIDPADAVGFARSLRFGDADFLDFESHAPWGGDVTINAGRDAEYLFPCTAAGARVTIDGAPATSRAARVPMLVAKIPAGRHRVTIRYGDEALGRQWLVIAAAAAVVASFLGIWLGTRTKPGEAPPA